MVAILCLQIAASVSWHAVRPGVSQAESRLAATVPLSSVRVIALRFDPALLVFRLEPASPDDELRGEWSVDSLPPEGVAAFNIGQFQGFSPWGWLVRDGIELQPPGSGSLAMAFVVDSAGAPELLTQDELAAVRGHVQLAFQSYPALLIAQDQAPWELQQAGRGVNLGHRDSRLALCTTSDGQVIVALTRFGGMGRFAETLPFGPTVGEMAQLMHGLGCRRAMLLDGGISSQLVVRQASGELSRWANWRTVPLGLVVTPRSPFDPTVEVRLKDHDARR